MTGVNLDGILKKSLTNFLDCLQSELRWRWGFDPYLFGIHVVLQHVRPANGDRRMDLELDIAMIMVLRDQREVAARLARHECSGVTLEIVRRLLLIVDTRIMTGAYSVSVLSALGRALLPCPKPMRSRLATYLQSAGVGEGLRAIVDESMLTGCGWL
jgi:hypothetical protein